MFGFWCEWSCVIRGVRLLVCVFGVVVGVVWCLWIRSFLFGLMRVVG